MKYVLMIRYDSEAPEHVRLAQNEAGCGGWIEEMTARGVLEQCVGLDPSGEATMVRVRDEVLIADGPFAETKDQIGGINLIEAANLEEAVRIAAEHPSARYGMIEIRPVYAP